MCFSAQVSFGASVVIGAVGVACLRKVNSPKQLWFAVIPFLFALQQFSEGIVWESFMHLKFERWRTAGTYVFLVFAHAVWPVLIPLALLQLEQETRRRQWLFLLSGMSVVLACYYLLCLFTYPVQATIASHHIRYVRQYPKELFILSGIFYGIVTIAPAFISTIKKVWLMGVLIALSYAITGIFYREFVASVWCFLAAVISVVVYWVLYGFKLSFSQDNSVATFTSSV